ncbi:MAG TPA: MbtH family protein [Candidatus Polarisedimenticolia bacterium]|nr:MbtH family protein [Candidatus Polarisedimenticolia bacterium]
MDDSTTETKRTYCVVMNSEEQYSLWPADRHIPLGWRTVGTTGSREECIAYIKETWVDMRPLSVRRQMSQSDAA